MSWLRTFLVEVVVASIVTVTAASANATETVTACSGVYATFGGVPNQQNIFAKHETTGIRGTDGCPFGQPGLQLQQDGVHPINPGRASSWSTTAPAGMVIQGASISGNTNNTVGNGYEAVAFWTGGSQRFTSGQGLVGYGFSAPTFGWMLECNPGGTQCAPNSAVIFDVQYAAVTVADTVNPSITAVGSNNLWYQGARGWVRGAGWPIAFQAAAPSGIAAMAASLQGTPIQLPAAPGCNRNTTVYQQCPSPQTWSPTVALPTDGPERLALSATSAAGNSSSPAETIYVDNTPPTISLSGPTGASSAQGTQYVTATATTGPSGLAMINCSVDGGPAQTFKTSPAQVPVAGLGQHTITCAALNHAVDVNGHLGSSAPATWHLDIGQPTSSVISFARIANALHCTRTRERVKVRVHHRTVTRVRTVRKCHARVVRRRVTVLVKVKRHGRTRLVRRHKIERVAVLPHAVESTKTTVRYGHKTTVHGWLGTASGVALPGRTLQVLTAPNDQLGQWATAATVTTDSAGGWSLTLPAGPSRLVRADYAGDPTTLAAGSETIHLAVATRIKLHITPTRAAWGHTILISGRVLGGHIPAGKLLRLRIGVAGVRATVGIPSIRRDGRFSTTWKFSSGRGVTRYWFSVSTLNEADYPYAPTSSERIYVTVGSG